MFRRVATILVLCAAGTACEQLPTDTMAAPQDAFAASAGVAWQHVVTGGGEDMYPGSVGPSYSITFNARLDFGGNAAGRVEWFFLDGTPASYGTVYCLEVRDNRAVIGYIAEGGAAGGYGTPGNSVIFGVEDNGEGDGAPPDRQSFIYLSDGLLSCSNHLDFVENVEGFPVVWLNGNVQVN